MATTLVAGSIAFVGASAQQRQDLDGVSRESFAFVALEDIAPNTTINFVDRGVSIDNTLISISGNGLVSWISDRIVGAGTIIEIRVNADNGVQAVTSLTASPTEIGKTITIGAATEKGTKFNF